MSIRTQILRLHVTSFGSGLLCCAWFVLLYRSSRKLTLLCLWFEVSYAWLTVILLGYVSPLMSTYIPHENRRHKNNYKTSSARRPFKKVMSTACAAKTFVTRRDETKAYRSPSSEWKYIWLAAITWSSTERWRNMPAGTVSFVIFISASPGFRLPEWVTCRNHGIYLSMRRSFFSVTAVLQTE